MTELVHMHKLYGRIGYEASDLSFESLLLCLQRSSGDPVSFPTGPQGSTLGYEKALQAGHGAL